MAGTNVPAIATDLLKVKYAQQSGDPTAAQIARQSLDAKLAQMSSRLHEKNYNTAVAQYQQAVRELAKTQGQLNILQHQTDVAVQSEKNKGLVAVEREKGTQNRLTGAQEDTHELKRLTHEADIAQDVLDDQQAHDLELEAYKTAGFVTDLRELGIPEDTITKILLGRNDALQETKTHEAQVMYNIIMGDESLSYEQKMAAWNSYNKIQPRSGSGKGGAADADPFTTEGQRDEAAKIVVDMLNTLPIEIDEAGGFLGIGGRTTGAAPTEEELLKYAYDMMDAAISSGINPQLMLHYIKRELSQAQQVIQNINIHEDEDPQSGATARIEKEWGPEYIEKVKRARKITTFFNSEAGMNFLAWLQHSETHGRYTVPRRGDMLMEQSQPQQQPQAQQEQSQPPRLGTAGSEDAPALRPDAEPQQEQQTQASGGGDAVRWTQNAPTVPLPNQIQQQERAIAQQTEELTEVAHSMGFQKGAVIEYTHTDTSPLKYGLSGTIRSVVLRRGMRFKVLGIVNREEGNYPGTGMLVSFEHGGRGGRTSSQTIIPEELFQYFKASK